jgi:2-oxo-4-hydroxy-4-carboxy-5-ureidoimidazoline decarboxylase
MPLSTLNNLDQQAAVQAFSQCCAATQWVKAMVAARPFKDEQEVYRTANSVWAKLGEHDYLEAFSAHPEIGNVESLRAKFANTKKLAAAEQAGVAAAADDVLSALAKGNADYRDHFGFIFIVCATGKSAAEILNLLQIRLKFPRAIELQNAAEEQRKITALRLEKLLHSATISEVK